MIDMDSVLVLTLAIYLVINIYPTVKVLKAAELNRLQRLFRILTIWLLPFFGGLIISLIYMINPAYRRGPYDVGSGYHSHDGSGEGGD